MEIRLNSGELVLELDRALQKFCSIAFYLILQCDVRTATGVYSCLSVDMQFKRQVGTDYNDYKISYHGVLSVIMVF